MDQDYYHNILFSSLGIPFTTNNTIKVLKNGDEIFSEMLLAIKEAEKGIDFLTFVYWTGDIANKFAEALSKKAEKGLKVRVVLDSFGASSMDQRLLTMMENSGVRIAWMRPVYRWKFWKIENRTHRKVLICDGKIGFTGGVGIAKEWEGNARNPDEWRETHFRITGPAVYGLHSAFLENWIETEEELNIIEHWNNGYYSKEIADGKIENGNSIVQVIRTSASVRWSDIVMHYLTLFGMARQSIRITTAYFNPNDAIIDLLLQKASEHVDIDIMMPGKHTDKRVAKIAAEEEFPPLLNAGINLYYYQKTMLHAKVITIDNIVSCVGSANFNHRSMLKDDEVNMVVLDAELNDRLNKDFEEDLQYCERVRFKEKGPFKKLVEGAVKIFDHQI